MRRDLLARAAGELDPIGYKIGLELIVKCRCRGVTEVPIHFSDRALGKSKMGLREQLRYIVHVRQLARWKYGELARFGEFALVGTSGLLVNLITVTAVSEALKATGMTSREAILNTSVTAAVLVSMASNFLLNRALTFGDRARQPLAKQFLLFVGVCLIGAVVNWFVTTRLALRWTDFTLGLQTASMCGVLAGMIFNYLGSRLFVFRGARA